MSKSAVTTFSCPRCTRSSQLTIWQSVNVSLDPELKNKLLSGELLLFVCPYCSYHQEVAYSLLYHDQNKKFMVWYIPADDSSQMKYNRQELAAMSRMMAGYKLRLVPSYNQLREKIYIFEKNLDDRAVEILKYFMWSMRLEDAGVDLKHLYFSDAYKGQDGLLEIEFIEITRSGEQRQFRVGGHMGYPRALEMMRNNYHLPVEEKTEWKIVDCNYEKRAQEGKG